MKWVRDSHGNWTSGVYAMWKGFGGWVVFANGYRIGTAQKFESAKKLCEQHGHL